MQQANEEPNAITTITGRPITVPVSFRLPTDHYQKLQERAAKEGKVVAALVQEWVLEKLAESPQEARGALE
jgi:hypothetical protein